MSSLKEALEKIASWPLKISKFYTTREHYLSMYTSWEKEEVSTDTEYTMWWLNTFLLFTQLAYNTEKNRGSDDGIVVNCPG